MGIPFALVYPVLAHAAIVLRSSILTLASVAALAIAVFLPLMARGSQIAWISALASGVAIFWLASFDAAVLVLYFPPILINAYLAWLFGRTLVSTRTPIIVKLVQLLHGPEEQLDDSIVQYASQLTAAWTALFVTLGLVNLVLALLAEPGGLMMAAGFTPPATVPRETWSLFANVLNYAIVAAFFLAEYAYRRRRFPQQPYRGLFDFLRRAITIAPAMLADSRREAGQRGR